MSGPLQERLCARTGKSTADVAVIPQYCEDFYAVPQHDAALEAQFAERFNVVFTGTFTPAQSLDMVIRAVLDARAAGAEHLHLLLVGDGMSREALQKQAADLHAGDAVTFYGSVPATDVPRFTALADALLISLSDSPDLGTDRSRQAGQLHGRGQAGAGLNERRGLCGSPGERRRACQPGLRPKGAGGQYAGAVPHDRRPSGPHWARRQRRITPPTTAVPSC